MKISTKLTVLILALAWIMWGTLVDMQGFRVTDQVIVSSILTVLAIILPDEKGM